MTVASLATLSGAADSDSFINSSSLMLAAFAGAKLPVGASASASTVA